VQLRRGGDLPLLEEEMVLMKEVGVWRREKKIATMMAHRGFLHP
jgi:hypothetical protein